MERKTIVQADDGQQHLTITREFDLPLQSLFMAYTESDILEQWMGTHVLKLENKKFGGFMFETTDPMGNKHNFSGAIHDFVANQKIVRTFEFEKMNLGVQLEFLDFEKLNENKSKLTIRSIYQSVGHREQALKMPFAYGLNMAHNKLQEILTQKK